LCMLGKYSTSELHVKNLTTNHCYFNDVLLHFHVFEYFL
jgi:hypothetical protein